MMKLFEVKVEKVDCEGHYEGYENIAYTLTEAKANEIANTTKAEIKTHDCWWMTYGMNNKEPRVVVKELGVITEQ